MTYWDTSALVKLYVLEPDSADFLKLVARAEEPLLTSDIARAEVLCALHRKEHAGDLKAGSAAVLLARFASDAEAGRIVLIPNGEDVAREAERLVARAYAASPPIPIRSLDAIHVASALACKAATVVATDRRLREAASLMGLDVTP